LIRKVAEYIVAGGGKRLRPLLLLLAANACGYRGEEHYTLAAVVELIHTATLLHDDVVDESGMRRGKATANAMFGNAASVVLGDAPEPIELALADYGMHLGTAFQLTDDVLDYSGEHDAIGKNLGDDLAEGKATLPLIHALRRGTPDEAALLRQAIVDGGLQD